MLGPEIDKPTADLFVQLQLEDVGLYSVMNGFRSLLKSIQLCRLRADIGYYSLMAVQVMQLQNLINSIQIGGLSLYICFHLMSVAFLP